MRWKGRRESENVEDRRTMSPGGVAIGGLGGLILIVLAIFLGADPRQFMGAVGPGAGGQAQAPVNPEEDELASFVKVILADTEDVWTELFAKMGKQYVKPTLVIYRDRVQSACGLGSAAMGPFYCPGDQKVYIDLSFYEELRRRHGAPGDFAQAYVIAHEIGHHVQNLLGISDEISARRQRVGKEEGNELSVRLELQADFFAGVWAHHAQRMKNILEQGDIQEAMNAAKAIGDDRLQSQAQGYVIPESFTHGTSEQRAKWFRKGLQTGDPEAGDTFSTSTRDL